MSKSTLLRALTGLLLGLVFALCGHAARDDGGCSCPMAHEVAVSCCCDTTAGPLTRGGTSCASTCTGAPQTALAAPPVAPSLPALVIVAAPAAPWPIPAVFADVGTPPLPERARPPPHQPPWLQNRALLI